MLPKSQRLSTSLFTECLIHGKSFHSSFFTLKLLKNVKDSAPSRFSVTVPKKVSPTAVGRNKIRRRVYSAIRGIYPRIKPSFVGVFIVKSAAVKASFGDISLAIQNILGKISLLK